MGVLLTPKEVADILHVRPTTVISLARDGRLRAVAVGGVWRFRASDVDAYIADNSGVRHVRGVAAV